MSIYTHTVAAPPRSHLDSVLRSVALTRKKAAFLHFVAQFVAKTRT
jgi:hypothetical protein